VTAPALDALLGRQLHFVSGKGGVGKSVVACALARMFVDEGKRVLLAQVNAADSHAALLGTSAIGADMHDLGALGSKSGGRLTAVNIVPAAAMKEYALMTLRFEAVYRTVFENRITKVFLKFVPSLNELTVIGKLWFHAEEQEHGRPRFDRIVVDCPSTGHGVKLLAVSRIVHDASRVGPMAEKTGLMARLVESPARTALHIVTLPEELPVNETFDLVHTIQQKRTAPLGGAFVNQVLPTLFDPASERALAQLRDHAGDQGAEKRAVVAVADARRQRERIEVQQRARMLELGLPVVEIPKRTASAFGPHEVADVAALIARVAKGGRP
jgi:anion-transporting  ArsA/GET3 family ATPase